MMMIMIEPNRRFVLASHTHGCTSVLLLVGRNKSDDSAWYEAEKINTHRWSPEKGYEYLVTWKGVDKDGKHEVTWEPAENATPGLVRGYNFMGEVATTPIMVGVNLWDIVGAVRARVAAGLAMDNIAKDKKADCRPRIHEMVVPELWSEALATAFLQLMTEPWKLRPGTAPKEPLTIKTYEDDKDGVITKQLELTDLKDVESFCAFEVYLGMACAIGLLRYDVGRKSNVDLMQRLSYWFLFASASASSFSSCPSLRCSSERSDRIPRTSAVARCDGIRSLATAIRPIGTERNPADGDVGCDTR